MRTLQTALIMINFESTLHRHVHAAHNNEIGGKFMPDIMAELYQTIESRKNQPAENSYTNYLFDKGPDKICKKVGEECAEVIIAAKNGDPAALIGEAADVLYHLSVLLCQQGVAWDSVRAELEERAQKIGNKKVFKDVDRNT
jgi:phosphoribosyl-ATP pyrophosphohydrolase